MIKRHEGYTRKVYLDTVGMPTVGWGHAFLQSPRPAPGATFSDKQCEAFFDDDMQEVERAYVFLEKRFDLEEVGHVRRAVLKDMLFNLGLTKLLKFRRFFAAIIQGNPKEAAKEMLDSRWAKQVKGRATELASMWEKDSQWAM